MILVALSAEVILQVILLAIAAFLIVALLARPGVARGLVAKTRGLIAKNDALWTGRGGTLAVLAALALLVNTLPLALLIRFGTYGAACAAVTWTAEQVRWAGWLLPLYEVSCTLILAEFFGLAGVIGISGLLRLGSIIHTKMRS